MLLTHGCNAGCKCSGPASPVCGSDGNSYPSTCEACRAGVTVRTRGNCKPSKCKCRLSRSKCNVNFCSMPASCDSAWLTKRSFLGITHLPCPLCCVSCWWLLADCRWLCWPKAVDCWPKAVVVCGRQGAAVGRHMPQCVAAMARPTSILAWPPRAPRYRWRILELAPSLLVS
jgi:hypothetical protein